jgi:hypothetical protein
LVGLFSEVIRPVTLNFSTLVLVQEEETFAVDFDVDCSSLAVVTPVALQEEVQEGEEIVVSHDEDPTDADATSSTTGGPCNYCFEFASSLWQDASGLRCRRHGCPDLVTDSSIFLDIFPSTDCFPWLVSEAYDLFLQMQQPPCLLCYFLESQMHEPCSRVRLSL